MVIRKREIVVTNKIQCSKCDDIIESTNRHDFRWCKCGSIAVDGGKSYLRRVGELHNIVELSETYYEEYESDF
jgi:tRNA(Ile2) C34 agmatinyltransferase TiaS